MGAENGAALGRTLLDAQHTPLGGMSSSWLSDTREGNFPSAVPTGPVARAR